MLRGDRLLFANRQMHDLLGAPIGSLDNGRSSDILADIERHGELLQRVADEGAVTGFDAAIRCQDGRELWVTINAAPVDYEDGPAIFIGLLDITVRRNAFGRQVDSFETDLQFAGIDGDPVRAVFIRAPWVERVGPGVEVLASVPDGPAAGRVVAVKEGSVMATSFHPEVTGDNRVHKRFVDLVRST